MSEETMKSGIFTKEQCTECFWQEVPNCPRVINDNPELDQMCDNFTQIMETTDYD